MLHASDRHPLTNGVVYLAGIEKAPLAGGFLICGSSSIASRNRPRSKSSGVRITNYAIRDISLAFAIAAVQSGLHPKFPRTMQTFELTRPPSLAHRIKTPHGSKDARQGISFRNPSRQRGDRSLQSSSFQPTRLSPATQPHRQTHVLGCCPRIAPRPLPQQLAYSPRSAW